MGRYLDFGEESGSFPFKHPSCSLSGAGLRVLPSSHSPLLSPAQLHPVPYHPDPGLTSQLVSHSGGILALGNERGGGLLPWLLALSSGLRLVMLSCSVGTAYSSDGASASRTANRSHVLRAHPALAWLHILGPLCPLPAVPSASPAWVCQPLSSSTCAPYLSCGTCCFCL